MSVQGFDLSADEGWLAFVVRRTGKSNTELWVRSSETAQRRSWAKRRKLTRRVCPGTDRSSLTGKSVSIRSCPISYGRHELVRRRHTLPEGIFNAWDWSADGARILHNCPPPAAPHALCSSPRDATTTAESRTIIADPGHDFWQGRFSPDGRWVLFNAQPAVAGVSVIGVVPASGGKWTPITDATLWADKPTLESGQPNDLLRLEPQRRFLRRLGSPVRS